MAPRPTGFDSNWLNILKEVMSVRELEKIPEPSLSLVFTWAPLAGQSQLWRRCYWDDYKLLTSEHLLSVAGAYISLSHDVPTSEPWVTWVFPVLLAASGTIRLRAVLRTWWAPRWWYHLMELLGVRHHSALAVPLWDPTPPPHISISPSLHTSSVH